MYDRETAQSLTFSQYKYDAALREKGVTVIINMGISPGITNFLIGEHLHYLKSARRKEMQIESIDLYLLEDIETNTIIFSWSPVVALEKLSQYPLQLVNGRMVIHTPFTAARDYLRWLHWWIRGGVG